MPPKPDAAPRGRVCRLSWFINSRCDHSCRRCVPEACARRRPDLGAAGCRAALNSFVAFAAAERREAQIVFYPRQAAFTPRFTGILRRAGELRRRGRIARIVCAMRGDLPPAKIRLFRDAGMDACRLTIDGPAAVQDPMRRTGSFRDTLAAFRAARAAGIRVEPLVILVRFNAPHVAATLRLLLAEGFDDLALQAGIRGDAGAGDRRASVHPDPGSPWNDLLTAAEYRTVLRRALACLDAAGAPHRQARDRFIRNEPMFARLFFELHRGDEYERIVRRQPRKDVLPFVLRADGAVLCQDGLPEIGRFPGGSFREIYDAAHPLRWFATGGHPRYVAEKQRAFAKCRACPARRHCPPVLAGWQGRRLFYQPDVHCWVRD